MDQPNEIKAAAAVRNVDAAFLQSMGDKLFFDSNNSGKSEASDLLLVQVNAGKAMVFLNDRDGDGVFSPDELTGLAASDGFRAIIKTDVAGSVSGGSPSVNGIGGSVGGLISGVALAGPQATFD